jgi:hypothetical protein
MRPSNPYSLIPPGKIYRALDKSTECGGCIRLFVGRMHSDAQTAVPPNSLLMFRLRFATYAGTRADATDRPTPAVPLVTAARKLGRGQSPN